MAEKGQVIELIQPDRPRLASAPTPGQPPRTHGPRWVAPAVLTFGALVVVTAIIWSADTETAGLPDATVVTSTTMRPLLQSVGPDVVQPERFAADPPPLWSVHSADELTPADPSSKFKLWATPGASATEGQWVSVSITPGIQAFDAVPDATRSLIGRFEATTPAYDAQRRDVQVEMLLGTATISAHGVDDADLALLAATLQGTGGTLRFDALLPDGLQLVTQGADAESMMTGDPVSRVIYTSDDPNGTPIDVTFTVGSTGALEPAVQLFPFVLSDLKAGTSSGWVKGRSVARPDELMLRWRSGNYVFTLSGPVGSSVLAQFATLVRPYSAQEWEQMVYGRPPGARLASLVQVAAGTTTDGHGWTAGVRIVERDGRLLLLWAAAPLDHPEGSPFSPPLDHALAPTEVISSLVIPGATYVFASSTSDSPNIALEITVGDRVVRAAFVDVEAGIAGVRVAAYAFSEPVAFVARFVEG